MPESPLVQIETSSLSDLEALIAARAKGESETEPGFRRRIDREEKEYQAACEQLAAKFEVDLEAMEAEYKRPRQGILQTVQRDTQATEAEFAQTKQQIDDQYKKDQRRAKKAKEETGWHRADRLRGDPRSRGPSGDGRRRQLVRRHRGPPRQAGHRRLRAEAVRPPGGAALPRARRPPRPMPPRPMPPRPNARGSPRGRGERRPAAADDLIARLQGDLGRIDEELLALDALKLPKFCGPRSSSGRS